MLFRMLHDIGRGNLTYLLADEHNGDAVVIDPQSEDIPVLQAMLREHGLQLRWLLRTHEHDARRPGELLLLQEGLRGGLVQHHSTPEGGASLGFGQEQIRVLHTPGHTAHCLSFLWRDRLFCGGLLCTGGCHFQRQPQSPRALWDSVHREVFALPAETLVFSGHGAPGRMVNTVHEHRLYHPWFAGISRDQFLSRRQAGTAPA